MSKGNHHPDCGGDNCEYGQWCACDCHADPTIQHGAGRPRLDLKPDTRPCPICGTNCSGCLEDLAAKQEGLRELLSYCETQADVTSAECPSCNQPEQAYRDVAQKLAPLLDGEA